MFGAEHLEHHDQEVSGASSLPGSTSPAQRERVGSLALGWGCEASASVGNPGVLQREYPDRQMVRKPFLGELLQLYINPLPWFIFTFNPEEFPSDVLTLFSHVLLELTCKATFQHMWDTQLGLLLKVAFLTPSHLPLVDFPFKMMLSLRKILEETMCCFPFLVK